MSPEIIGAIIGPFLSALIAVAGFFARESYEKRRAARQLAAGSPTPAAQPGPAGQYPPAHQQQPTSPAPPVIQQSGPQPPPMTQQPGPAPRYASALAEPPAAQTPAWPSPWASHPVTAVPVDRYQPQPTAPLWPQQPPPAHPVKRLLLLDVQGTGAKITRVLFYLALAFAAIWVAAVIDTQIINPDPNASDDGVFVNAFAISFTTAVGMLPAVFLGSLARSIDKRYRLKRLVSQLPGRPAYPGY